MRIIPDVIVNGSPITESTKAGHVTYRIERYEIVGYDGGGTDPEGNPLPSWPVWGWVNAGSGSTGAKITGTIVCSNKMRIGGTSVAKVGDKTNETWTASPPVPSSNSSMRYTPTSPTSGSGQGSITGGSAKGKLVGSGIALVGSQVTTCLGSTTTVQSGNSKMKIGS